MFSVCAHDDASHVFLLVNSALLFMWWRVDTYTHTYAHTYTYTYTYTFNYTCTYTYTYIHNYTW